jgi:hypothetical protein
MAGLRKAVPAGTYASARAPPFAAKPSAVATLRPVNVIAEATPACDRGMPALLEEPRPPLVVAGIAITASGIMLTRCSPAPR